MTTDSPIDSLALRAAAGDRDALTRVVAHVQHPVYGLAMRMLGDPDVAADATQEILIKVITRLGSFRRTAKLTTWVYRVAMNHLIDETRRGRREGIAFERLAGGLGQPAAPIDPRHLAQADRDLLVEETFLGCTHAMLLCLDRAERAAFILGAILELEGAEAAAILDVSPTAFRKRLSRARAKLRTFLQGRCGEADASASCQCAHQVNINASRGFLVPDRLRLATHARRQVRATHALVDELGLFRRHPDYLGPDFAARLDTVLDAGKN